MSRKDASDMLHRCKVHTGTCPDHVLQRMEGSHETVGRRSARRAVRVENKCNGRPSRRGQRLPKLGARPAKVTLRPFVSVPHAHRPVSSAQVPIQETDVVECESARFKPNGRLQYRDLARKAAIVNERRGGPRRHRHARTVRDRRVEHRGAEASGQCPVKQKRTGPHRRPSGLNTRRQGKRW